MKKIYLPLIALLGAFSFCHAQWTTSGSNIYNSNSGNVGIGTTTPISKLQIAGLDNQLIGYFHNNTGTAGSVLGVRIEAGTNSADYALNVASSIGTSRLYVRGDGNVGIGTTTPTTALQLGDFSNGSASNQLLIPGTYNFEQLRLGQTGNGNMALEFVNHMSTAPSYGIKFLVDVDSGFPGLQLQYAAPSTTYAGLSYTTGFCMNTSGNVGIGTTNTQGYKFAVNGSAIATSMTVKLYTNWPDYVFKKDYRLPGLADVKAYIDQNHRLPEMPSEQQIARDGLNLGEMNRLLTKKVEQLTLYLIEKDNKDKEQSAQLKSQQQKINRFQEQLHRLIKSSEK